MKVKQAIERSKNTIAYNIKKTDTCVFIFTANIGWNNKIEFNRLVFKNGILVEFSGVSNKTTVPLNGWISL